MWIIQKSERRAVLEIPLILSVSLLPLLLLQRLSATEKSSLSLSLSLRGVERFLCKVCKAFLSLSLSLSVYVSLFVHRVTSFLPRNLLPKQYGNPRAFPKLNKISLFFLSFFFCSSFCPVSVAKSAPKAI